MAAGLWKQPLAVSLYRVFLSSGNDALQVRERLDRLITNVVVPQLSHADAPFRIEVVRWEAAAAQRVPSEHTNDLFVEQACRCHLVIVLLLQEIRPGTREEIQAVLDEKGIDVAVLQFGDSPSDTQGWADLNDFLEANRERLFYKRVESLASEDAEHELLRVLIRLVIRAFLETGGR